MSSIRFFKYLLVYTGPIAGLVSFMGHGISAWVLPLYVFGLIPLLEYFIPPDASNLNENEEQQLKQMPLFDFLLYLIVPIHYFLFFFFLWTVGNGEWTGIELAGKTLSMGILCGAIGINVAHELGHRIKKHETWMAKALLLTSLYMHFFIEHNRGHHKNVSTEEDPSSARKGESLYAFWIRSVWFSYLSAWALENHRLKKKGVSIFSLQNEMLVFQLLQIALISFVLVFFGWLAGTLFILSAIIGFLLLETVNYIEHYGLRRKILANGISERVSPSHSWNSDHVLGRIMLFELSRHSDHHYHAGRKYQVLRHFENSPQMPTGYPGMMLLSLLPPLWFRVMDKRIENQEG